MTKEFKSFDEQIKILKNRHLVIDDEDKVKYILTFHNYYNVINGYKTIFCYYDEYNNEYFFEGTNFDEIYALYCFDRELRSIIFKYTLEIENSLRTIISHTFSKYHGVENYMRYSNFDILDYDSASKKNISRRAEYINELISNIQMDLARSITKKDYINHYIVRYGYVPLWVLVNNISFSRLSTFYKLMKQSERVEVSKYWGILEKDLSSYLELLAYFRNLCAHDDRIYNAKCKKNISNTSYHSLLDIPKNDKGEYLYGKNDILALLIASKILLPSNDFCLMIEKIDNELSKLSGKIKIVSMNEVYKQIGLPHDWIKIKS